MPTRKAAQNKSSKNGSESLEAAMTSLIQSQALLNQNQAFFNQQIAQTNAEIRTIERANAERFARIEQLLLQHDLMLRELPEAIRQKIGFQKQPGK